MHDTRQKRKEDYDNADPNAAANITSFSCSAQYFHITNIIDHLRYASSASLSQEA